MISIPRIQVVPKGDVRTGFEPFTLDLSGLRYQPVSDELFAQHLRTGVIETLTLGRGAGEEARLEDYVVSGRVDFDDVAHDDHADLLYALAAQTVAHLKGYLPEKEVEKVLRFHQREIARFVHAQMQAHYVEDAVEYEVNVSRGFVELKGSALTAPAGEAVLHFKVEPADKSNMAKYLFGGFQRCLFHPVRFQSDTERRLSVILDRDAIRWFRPAKGQLQIFYRRGAADLEYVPDFVAEAGPVICMIESKAANEMDDPEVQAKRDVAVEWCRHASAYAAAHGGKAWKYLLVAHNEIAENMTLDGMTERLGE